MDKKTVIDTLQLEPHIEGGFFKRTYRSPHKLTLDNTERVTMSSIYYMLTTDSPIGCIHKNQSDIMCYYQLGLPLQYLILFPDGKLEETILGPDLMAGHKLQLLVPGGTWLSTALVTDSAVNCDFGLVSEAVTPGFEYQDMTIGTEEIIQSSFPELWEKLKKFVVAKKS